MITSETLKFYWKEAIIPENFNLYNASQPSHPSYPSNKLFKLIFKDKRMMVTDNFPDYHSYYCRYQKCVRK